MSTGVRGKTPNYTHPGITRRVKFQGVCAILSCNRRRGRPQFYHIELDVGGPFSKRVFYRTDGVFLKTRAAFLFRRQHPATPSLRWRSIKPGCRMSAISGSSRSPRPISSIRFTASDRASAFGCSARLRSPRRKVAPWGREVCGAEVACHLRLIGKADLVRDLLHRQVTDRQKFACSLHTLRNHIGDGC